MNGDRWFEKYEQLKEFLLDPKNQWEIGRARVEAQLVEMRDARIGLIGRNNGLVIKEKDGSDSHTIRMGPEMALDVAIRAMLEEFEK